MPDDFGFDDYFAAWKRIEPRCRSDDFSEGLQARTADPLWLLARQWQFAEFEGEDAGSPIEARMSYWTRRLDEVLLGDTDTPVPLAGGPPLEVLIEREPVAQEPIEVEEEPTEEEQKRVLDWRSRAQIGREFEQLLRANLPAHAVAAIRFYRSLFPVPADEKVDEATRSFLRLAAARVIDGGKLKDAIEENRLPRPDHVDQQNLQKAVAALKAWWGAMWSQPDSDQSDAWSPKRLCHRFRIRAVDGDTTVAELEAGEYRSGEFDWYSVSLAKLLHPNLPPEHTPLNRTRPPPDSSPTPDGTRRRPRPSPPPGGATLSLRGSPPPGGGTLPPPGSPPPEGGTPPPRSGERGTGFEFLSETVTPTRLTFPGMPLARWWAFEDSRIDFGSLDVQASEDAKLFLMEFALIYGDDWFELPISLPLGTLAKITRLEVTDVFGDTTEIGPVADEDWEMFTLSRRDDPLGPGEPGVLFLAPTAPFKQESAPLEEVVFSRDEVANMVVAVEQTVRNGLGDPVSGIEQYRELGGGEPELGPAPGGRALPRYKLMTEVPPDRQFYIPSALVPEDPLAWPLRRASVPGDQHGPLSSVARSSVVIYDRSVPQNGAASVHLTRQRVRWTDGKTYVWLGRKVLPGRAERSSGLRFDILVESEQDRS